jgi:ribosomal protein S18 acetylase RimI-like enzyme
MSDPKPSDTTQTIHDFFVIRPGRTGDHAFIADSWQNAHARTAIGKEMGPHYMSEQKELVRRILSWPTTIVRVAADKEDDEAIHGYAVTSESTDESKETRLYYIYVKHDARRLGIANALIGHLRNRPVTYTHKPKGTPCVHCTGQALADVLPRPSQWTFSYFANFTEI